MAGPPPLPDMPPPAVASSKRLALSRRRPPPTGNGVTPYLDVMTMTSTKFSTKGELVTFPRFLTMTEQIHFLQLICIETSIHGCW